jgi:hypothetical protein
MPGGSVSEPSNKLAGFGALLVVSASTFACIFEESNYELGGRRTDPTEEVDLNDVDSRCIQGGCKQLCGDEGNGQGQGENCKCIGGKCDQECGSASTCTCSAGGCTQRCAATARCACSGGRCIQECAAGSICSCGGENCTCTGDGCR